MHTKKEMEEYFGFLDKLRESAEINMYAAAPCLTKEFGLNKYKARAIVNGWMSSFAMGKPASERAENALKDY